MRTVTIVGAGFAGLTLAHHLVKQGFHVEIHERQERAGGMIDALNGQYGLIETAANALLADAYVEELFEDLGLEFAEHLESRKNKYIYWEEPKRWTLPLVSSLKLARLIFHLKVTGMSDYFPGKGESVGEWAERVVDKDFEERFLGPALQGVYAGDVRRLSANLILKSFLSPGAPKGSLRGSVAPAGGMVELINKMVESLKNAGTRFVFRSKFEMPEYLTTPLVIATSAWSAAELLKNGHPEISQVLQKCESLPLVRATCFYEPSDDDLQGFGCLFPMKQEFRSLGVLFDSCIFKGRSQKKRAESWILGGAMHPAVVAYDDREIIAAIGKDRERLTGRHQTPLEFHVTRWQRAIPHYTTSWEKYLKTIQTKPPLFLHGNYLGDLGLSRLHARSRQLATQIKEMYG